MIKTFKTFFASDAGGYFVKCVKNNYLNLNKHLYGRVEERGLDN